MLRVLTPFRLVLAALAVAAVAFAVWAVPTDSYIFLPNRAHEVAPLVEVQGGRDPTEGGIYFVDVLVRKATLLERLWPDVRDGATVVPGESVRPPGVSDEERRRAELAEMRRSQRVAAAVALRELGYDDVVANPSGARIEFVDPNAPAAGQLQTGDVVVRADGRPVRVPGGLRRIVTSHDVGDVISLAVQRDGRIRRVNVRTMRGTEGRAVIGVIVSQAANIRLPVDVEIDTGGVGGPSAGLAFALDLLEELGRDVDRGNRVAVTGTIELDGSVGEVGGLKQKTIGVQRAGIRVFVVPAGENAREARRHAGDVRIVPVETFQQALRALATLPRNAQD